MADANDHRPNKEQVSAPFLDSWSNHLNQVSAAQRAMLTELSGQDEPPSFRNETFESLSKSLDEYLRSSSFMQAMRQHIDALIQARLQTAQHGTRSANSEIWNQFLDPLPANRNAGWVNSATACDVVYEHDSVKLLRFRSAQSVSYREPVVIAFALVNRPYILDLQVQRSVVGQLLRQGLDVYMIDWGIPTSAEYNLGLHDYVCHLMKHAVDAASEQSGSPRVHLLGYCMGGTMATMFSALYPSRVQNLVLLAAPIDFSGEESLLNLWTREEYFDVDGLVDAYGNCPGFFLDSCFQLMKPVTNCMEKYLIYTDKMKDPSFLENFMALERWSRDSIPVAGRTFREFVRMLYRENRLVEGTMQLQDLPVRLENIECPVLMLVAEQDHLVPPQATLALRPHLGSQDVEQMSVDAGHIGLAVSSRAHRQLWPAASQWLVDRSTRRGHDAGGSGG